MRSLIFTFILFSFGLIFAQTPLKMQVYPNPASDRIRIEFSEIRKEPVQVILTDILGNTIVSLEFRPEDPVIIDLTALALPDGIYLVKTTVQQNTLIRKLVIRHP